MSDKIIMVVDDDKSNLSALMGYLDGTYKVVPAVSGENAIQRLERVTPDLILLDNKMPGMNGVEVMDYLRSKDRLCRIPVIVVSSDHDADTERAYFVHGAADFITKPLVSSVLLERIRRTLEYWELRNDLERKIDIKTKEKKEVLQQAITAIANAIDAKDAYTKGHSERVAQYSAMIAKELGLDDERAQQIHNIALLHDIGKIGIPDSILNKPGRLSDREFSIIKQHTITGGEILKDIDSMRSAFTAARFHHERYDGKGYPNGLKGEEIPIIARIISVADAYDAMTSNRVYRKKLSNDIVMAELKKGMGTQFDPEIAQVFTNILVKNNFFQDEKVESGNAKVTELLDKQQEIEDYEETHDTVSGLFRISHAMELIDRIPSKEEWAFCLIDVTHLRRINDVHGRIQGDYVLSVVADIIQENLRQKDIAYRACGGVFGVCLREQPDREEVSRFAQRLVDKYRERTQQVAVMRDTDIKIGICMTQDCGHNFHQIYRNADCALFYAKQKGELLDCYFYERSKQDWEPMEKRGIARLVGTLFSAENREKFYATGNECLIRRLDWIAEHIRQSQTPCTLVLLELNAIDENMEEYGRISDSMNNLELAVMEHLCEQDLGMRFSSSQYVVVLAEDEPRDTKDWCDMVSQQYYRLDSSTRFELEFGAAEHVQADS